MSLLLGVPAMAQAQRVYSTHDWTASSAGPEHVDRFREVWADVKTPGDGNQQPGIGKQYAVGTVEVRTTQNASFSGEIAEPVTLGGPGGTQLAAFAFGPGQKRQVVMIQCSNAEPYNAAAPQGFQEILWQRFFYGTDALGEVSDRAANARAIAVWPTLDPATTRIAICGETYDEQLPGSGQVSFPTTPQAPTGFIAVLDGNGYLLWAHHVYGSDPTHSCAITDVSIRVESDGRETVTYCGISSNGDPGPGTPLSQRLEPITTIINPSGQWSGIVGRVSRAAGAKQIDFAASIGIFGVRDGLFGLAELDYSVQPPMDRFVVVGSSVGTSVANEVGDALVFDALPTWTATGHLIWSGFAQFGEHEDHNTIARDVVVLREGYDTGNGLQHLCAIVGSTDDPDMMNPLLAPWGTFAPYGGGADGFVMLARDDPANPANPSGFVLEGGSFYGGPGEDGLTGVQGWNEYPDSFAAVGFTEAEGGDLDIGVASYYLVSDDIANPPTGIRQIRRDQIGGHTPPPMGVSADERPAGMGLINATTIGLLFDTFGLNDPAGGGVAVDQRARVNVVGFTEAADYPALAPGRPRDPAPPADAVRSVFDMLPPPLPTQAFGVGRSDRSGEQGPFVLPTNFSGGTSPACSLSPFGWLLGEPRPILSRMLVDYEGDQPRADASPTTAPQGGVIISRPSSFVFTAWQFDVPGTVGTPSPFIGAPPFLGTEFFINPLTAPALVYVGFGLPGHALRQNVVFVFAPLPTAPAMTLQCFCWFPGMPQPADVWPACAGPVGTTEATASPAMWLPL